MTDNEAPEDEGIPDFLSRKLNPELNEVPMRSPTRIYAPEAETGTAPAKAKPVKAKAVKAVSKPAAKPVKAAKPDKAKAAKPAKAGAKKPRNVDPAKLDEFGLRLGSMKSKAAKMYSTKKGATLAEVKEALESTQFNVLTEMEAKGHTVDRSQEDGEGNRKVTRYKLIAK